ncbi:MAG: DUF547 domain-containing protein [Dongiaceae bacterium]
MSNLSRRTLLLGLGSALGFGLAPHTQAAPLAAFAPVGTGRTAHERFDALLRRYVRPDAQGYNRVDYRSFRQSGRGELCAYLGGLAAQDPTRLSADEAHAYWINFYNAKTLDVVLEHYPAASIRTIDLGGGGLFEGGPWSKKVVTVMGTDLSLDDIEHRIVRPLFADRMSHYGLNCASYSCPNLGVRAYTGETLAAMLAQGARDYVNHPRGIAISAGAIRASKIYYWYADDFGGKKQLKTHWKAFAASDLGARIDAAEIGGYAYDWSLNDV